MTTTAGGLLVSTGTTGTFQLVFEGYTTSSTTPLQYNDTAADIQAELEALPSIGPNGVTVSGTPTASGGSYLISFINSLANTSMSNLTAIAAGGDTIGAITSGFFDLTYNGVTSATMPYNAPVATVQAALTGLTGGNATVASTPGTTSGSYIITLTGSAAGTFGSIGDVASDGVNVITTQNELTGQSLNSLFSSTAPNGDSVAIIPNTVTVSGSPGQFDVEFAGQVASPGQAVSTLVPTATNATVTVGNVTATNDVQLVNVTGNAGTFTLSFNGQTTTPLAYNATPAAVQAALQALPTFNINNSNFNVSVAGTPVRTRLSSTAHSAAWGSRSRLSRLRGAAAPRPPYCKPAPATPMSS